MYSILEWKDHAVTPGNTYTVKENADGTITLTPAGTIVQQGTNMSAANFNNMEFGIADSDLAARILLVSVRNNSNLIEVNAEGLAKAIAEYEAEFAVEQQTVTLTNSASYPFNNSAKSVSLVTNRKTTNYIVEAEATASDGNVGEVIVSGKALNGFKVAFTGSATTATIKLKIRGGMSA